MATANPQPTKTKPLIQRVEVRNFKCLRAVDVDLEPLTVLIGKNDTGKSSFLEAIQAVAFAFTGRAVDLTSKFTTGCRKEDFGVTAQVGDKRLTLAFDEQHGQRTNSKSVGKVPPSKTRKRHIDWIHSCCASRLRWDRSVQTRFHCAARIWRRPSIDCRSHA